MLIHIYYFQDNELAMPRLMFNFEESFLHRRIGSFTHRIKKGKSGADQIKVRKGDQIFAQVLPGQVSSFCFWVPVSVKSGLNIVISPLSSLMRDQGVPFKMNPLARDKIKNINYTDISLGRIRLIYIAPKSLISRSFRDDLNAIINGASVNTLLIDKAHCISEWGHDFRPSYLRLPVVIDDLRKNNPKLTTIALTANSGKMVRHDILDILNLRDKTPRPSINYYQANISFQVKPVKSSEEKEKTYKKILQKDIPQILYKYGFFPDALTSFPAYKDPYSALLNLHDIAQTDSLHQPNILPDLCVTTRIRKKAPDPAHIMVHTSLGGSLESWMYQIFEAGKNGTRIHCVRLAEIPCKECETFMQQNFTRIPKCLDFKCSFGRPDLCDYGKQHHLITKSYPEMETGIIEILQTLNHLITSFQNNDTPVQISVSAVNQKKTELALFRLSIIRVIDMFFIDYNKIEPVFKIYGFTNTINEEAALAGLLAYLKRNDISSTKKYKSYTIETLKADNGEIAKNQERYGQSIQKIIEYELQNNNINNYYSHKHIFHKVSEYLPLILFYIYDEVRNMHYWKLWNLKEFIKNKTCLYNGLLRTVQAVDEEWTCGKCNQCVPDLKFEQPHKILLEQTDKIKELEQEFRSWLENDNIVFDSVTADQFIDSFKDYYYNLVTRSKNSLEHAPRNIKAMYIVCELASEPLRSWYITDIMNIVFHDLKMLQVIRFYETSQVNLDLKNALFKILDDEYGVMNSPEGEKWLFHEALKIYPYSDYVKFLGSRMVLNAIKEIDIKTHKNKLNQLLKEF